MKKSLLCLLALLGTHSYAQSLFVPGGFSSSGIGTSTVSGTVGIGTNSPTGQLQIIGASGWDKSTRLYLTNGATDYGRTNLILTGRLQSGNDGWVFGSDSRSSIVFSSNNASSGQSLGATGTEQFSIQHEQVSNSLGFLSQSMGSSPILMMSQTGNVGIGTTSPNSKLDIIGQTGTGLRQNGTSGDYEALSVFNTTASNLASGNGVVLQFYNNAVNYNGVLGASIKSVSVNNQYGWESDLYLRTTKNNSYSTQTILDALVVKANTGNVGIGTTSPDAKLAVSGQVHAQEVKVSVTVPGPDYVFEKDYKLTSLEDIKNYIDENKHLPEVPSAKEMEKNGVQLGEMNMILLKKIEELTLYVIDQNKKIAEQTEVISKQNDRLVKLENQTRK